MDPQRCQYCKDDGDGEHSDISGYTRYILRGILLGERSAQTETSRQPSPGHNTHLLAVGDARNNAAGGAEHDLQAARHRALPALSAVVGLPCQRARYYAVDSRIPKECARVSRSGWSAERSAHDVQVSRGRVVLPWARSFEIPCHAKSKDSNRSLEHDERRSHSKLVRELVDYQRQDDGTECGRNSQEQ